MLHEIRVIQGTLGMLLSEGKGFSGTAFPKQPPKLLQLYEFEACPYCRRVRQALTTLNLDYEVYPCPKNGALYRPKVKEMTGKEQFPFLVDPNTQTTLLESGAIIDYLFRTYGKKGKEAPSAWRNLPKRDIKRTLISAVSMLRGLRADKYNISRINTGKQPQKLLEVYGFDMSPFTRLVRERLTELEIPYITRNVAKERWQDMGLAVLRAKPGTYRPIRAGKRDAIMNDEMGGKMQLPFLVDPNTQTRMFESKDIMAYINKTYGC